MNDDSELSPMVTSSVFQNKTPNEFRLSDDQKNQTSKKLDHIDINNSNNVRINRNMININISNNNRNSSVNSEVSPKVTSSVFNPKIDNKLDHQVYQQIDSIETKIIELKDNQNNHSYLISNQLNTQREWEKIKREAEMNLARGSVDSIDSNIGNNDKNDNTRTIINGNSNHSCNPSLNYSPHSYNESIISTDSSFKPSLDDFNPANASNHFFVNPSSNPNLIPNPINPVIGHRPHRYENNSETSDDNDFNDNHNDYHNYDPNENHNNSDPNPPSFEKEALALQEELSQMQKALQDRMQRYQVLTSLNPTKK
jgi:hypothetical protein